jgi:CheY-like chemotaxis protein
MAQLSQHVLVIDQHSAYRMITEVVLRRAGRRVTLAEDYDQAVAVLRSSLHPLVVHTNTYVIIPGKGYGSMLLELLGNPDFAATHAFVVSSALDGDRLAAMRERIAQTGAACVCWAQLPAKVAQIIAAQDAAEVWLRSRG